MSASVCGGTTSHDSQWEEEKNSGQCLSSFVVFNNCRFRNVLNVLYFGEVRNFVLKVCWRDSLKNNHVLLFSCLASTRFCLCCNFIIFVAYNLRICKYDWRIFTAAFRDPWLYNCYFAAQLRLTNERREQKQSEEAKLFGDERRKKHNCLLRTYGPQNFTWKMQFEIEFVLCN